LISNQPKSRLHSQLDVGATSQASKVRGREPARMNPADARARGLASGDVVLIRNARGSCLAGLEVSEALRPGVVQLSTGAWYDPDPEDPSFCRHGNPNVLTADRPSSTLSQGTTAQHTLVEVERWNGPLPAITVTGPPQLRLRGSGLG
jgi:biotin/methionine sulfoxide reductase